jgi:hypothetical protein
VSSRRGGGRVVVDEFFSNRCVRSEHEWDPVFNVGPAGHLNLHRPEPLSADTQAPTEAHRPPNISDVEMTLPAGRERLFAV